MDYGCSVSSGNCQGKVELDRTQNVPLMQRMETL